MDAIPEPDNLAPETPRHPRLQFVLICLGLVLATVSVYWRVGRFGFVNYDDVIIFFQNNFVRQGLTWESIVWGATTSFYEYWHPLMWWSHELDCQLFGLNAGPHHLVSLGFHVVNSLLVFAVFRRMTGKEWRSAAVAAVFALHPLHVESVAWLAERKDVLSTMFELLSIWWYIQFKAHTSKSRVYYALALLFFTLGLLSKPMVVTLPFMLVLLDYWPLERLSGLTFRIGDLKEKRRDSLAWSFWEKWPFFALTAIFCFTTWYSVKAGNHAAIAHPSTFGSRLENIPVTIVRYVWKSAWPVNLAALYPMRDDWHWWQIGGAILLVSIVFLFILVTLRSNKYLAVGWLWFLGALVPTIGLVQVGAQAMADRYMYVPLIGLVVAGTWGLADMFVALQIGRYWSQGFAVLTLATLGCLSWIQVGYWHDSVALWKHCIAAGYEGIIADHNLGRALIDIGQAEKGLEAYQAALRISPDDWYANLGLGSAYVAAGKPREATNYLAKALLVSPNDPGVHEDMGLALIDLGDIDGAILEFDNEIQLNPNDPSAYADLGKAESAKGESDDAINSYRTAIRLNPGYFAAHYYLGVEYLKLGSLDSAASNLEQAVAFSPATVAPRMQLAAVYERQSKTANAISQYDKVLYLNPDIPEGLNNLAWLLAAAPDARDRNGQEAVQLATHACDLTSWKQTIYVGTLAAAYAEAGDFDKAVTTAQKACDLATAHGEKELLQKNQELLQQYKRHEPVRGPN